METKKFKKRQIGLPDNKKKETIQRIYDNLVDTANQIKFSFEELIDNDNMEKIVSVDLFFDFLKSQKPEDWLIDQYIKEKGISFPGMSIEKIIELRLVEIPDYSEILKIRKEFDIEQQKLQEHNFSYSMRDLYTDEDNVFILTEYFYSSLNEAVTSFTQNEAQNEVLDSLEAFTISLNNFHKIGIVNITKMGLTFMDPDISMLFSIDRKNENEPVSVCPTAFRKKKLRRFFDIEQHLHAYTPAEVNVLK